MYVGIGIHSPPELGRDTCSFSIAFCGVFWVIVVFGYFLIQNQKQNQMTIVKYKSNTNIISTLLNLLRVQNIF